MEPGNKLVSGRVFEIPELVELICGFASHEERCAHLLRVNRHMFLYAGALVWKHVPGAVYLLRLITRAPCPVPSSISDPHTIKLDTSRLEVYAPFVQSLEAHCPFAQEAWGQSLWRAYPLHTQQKVNFPNLRRLTYTNQGEKVEENQLDYLLPFLSSSLREIKITALDGHLLWQSLSSVLKFLNLVSSQCPGLESLHIYPGKPSPKTGLDKNVRMVTLTDDTLAMHQTMGSFRGLLELAISPAVLEPDVLRTVSSYPYLEALTIRSKAYGGPVYDDYDLDDTAFPALCSLGLMDLDPHIMRKLCNFEPLLGGLEHATIRFGPGSDTAWKFNGDRGDSLFSLLKYCPELEELKFDIGKSDEGLSIPRLADLFRFRPLRSVNLTALVGLDERTKWPELFDALPLVEEFRVPRNGFNYLELRDFAIMLPRLRFLEISFLTFRPNLARVARDLEEVPNPSEIPLRFHFNIDIYRLLKEYKTIARCLHALWPNVKVKVKPDPHSPTEILAEQLSRRTNRALRELRDLSV